MLPSENTRISALPNFKLKPFLSALINALGVHKSQRCLPLVCMTGVTQRLHSKSSVSWDGAVLSNSCPCSNQPIFFAPERLYRGKYS
jgi:hypothetical protein